MATPEIREAEKYNLIMFLEENQNIFVNSINTTNTP